MNDMKRQIEWLFPVTTLFYRAWLPSPQSSPSKRGRGSKIGSKELKLNFVSILSPRPFRRGEGKGEGSSNSNEPNTKTCFPSAVAIGLTVLFLPFACSVRGTGAAEQTRFLVSYGGTAGYQLPLWVNKELGFSKKYGVDLEIILIQAGSPNIQ